MTEEEAKTKWCPMVRVLVTPNDAVWQNSMLNNRGEIPSDNMQCRCIASDCMLGCDDVGNWLGYCGLRK